MQGERIAAEEFAARAVAFVGSLRQGPAEYPEKPGDRPGLSGAALATAARFIAGALHRNDFALEREALAEHLHGKQNPSTGAYEDVSRDTPTSRRLNLSLFGWVLRALAMLGESPRHPIRFLRRWDDPEELGWWLGLLEWHRAARGESLRVMNVGVPRVIAARRGRRDLDGSTRVLFGWLQSHQDPASGFWGPAQGGDLIEGLGATFHVLTIYEAAGRQVPLAERVAGTVLDLWRPGEGLGDAWADMAALNILLKTAASDETLAAKAAEIARDAASSLTTAVNDGTVPFSSLSDAVTRLEALRAASQLDSPATTPELGPARIWRSAWDPGLWACEW